MAGSAATLRRYLSTHAEPISLEAAALAAEAGTGPWTRAVVIPVFDERLDGLARATEALRARGALLVVVVNESPEASEQAQQANAELANELREHARGPSQPGLAVCAWRDLDVLLIERTQRSGGPIPAAHGVGAARKIGIDAAAELRARELLQSSWIATTDADVELPPDYLDARVRPSAAGVATVPLWHCDGASEVHRLTGLYELWLRYYAEGLAWAGSAYGIPILGSALWVDAGAYAAVRGVPKRAAGEDFYLASKLIAHHGLGAVDCAPIRIAARNSSRTPFGTGPAVQRWGDEGSAQFYDPRVFALLQVALRRVGRIAAAGRLDAAGPMEADLADPWSELKVDAGLASSLRGATTEGARTARARQWFDALKTLRFIHALEASLECSRLPWTSALADAPFVPSEALRSVGAARSALAAQLRARQAAAPD